MTKPDEIRLLTERRFAPLFVAATLRAFGGCLMAVTGLILVWYRPAPWLTHRPAASTMLAAGLYSLPFVLFAGPAAGIALRHDTARVLKWLTVVAPLVIATAVVGVLRHATGMLFAAAFFLGLQSTLFAPVLTVWLKRHLSAAELMGGNALLQAGRALGLACAAPPAALLTMRGGFASLGALLAASAVAASLASLVLPADTAAPGLPPPPLPVAARPGALQALGRSRTLLLSVLGLSWFRIDAVIVLVLLPPYARQVLQADGSVAVAGVVVFCIGIALGALLCERSSGAGGRIEIGLVPLGSVGLTVFALDWAWRAPMPAADLAGLLIGAGGWRVLFDVAALGVFGGLFAVPLDTLVQQRSPARELPGIVGAAGALWVLLAAVTAGAGALAVSRGIGLRRLIGITALVNAAVAGYIYRLVPEFLLRLICWLLVHTLYRLQKVGPGQFPESGAALIVSNHVTFVDALVISAACRRPIHYIMDGAIFNAPIIRILARGMKAIPIASAKDDAEILERAFETTAQALRAGELVCIFPEGRLTRDGAIGTFRPGMMRILRETPVPVIPIAIVGLWGSMFSKEADRVWRRLPRKLGARIAVHIGASVDPADTYPDDLRRRVQAQLDRPI